MPPRLTAATQQTHEMLVDLLTIDPHPLERVKALFGTVASITWPCMNHPLDDMPEYPDTYDVRSSRWTLNLAEGFDPDDVPLLDLACRPLVDEDARIFAYHLERSLVSHAFFTGIDSGLIDPTGERISSLLMVERLADRTTLAALLWRARHAAKMSATELGGHLDVTGTTIGRWERGETNPTSYQIDAMANLLDISDRQIRWAQAGQRADDWPPAPNNLAEPASGNFDRW